jgi:hypothetical protein
VSHRAAAQPRSRAAAQPRSRAAAQPRSRAGKKSAAQDISIKKIFFYFYPPLFGGDKKNF